MPAPAPTPAGARAARVVVVGLGPGDPRHLTAAARDALDAVPVVHVRTARHPAVEALLAGRPVAACDDLYESAADFDAVYDAIAARLVDAARRGPVVYAVPGDPSFGETSVRRLREAARSSGIDVAVVPGVSFVGPTLDLLGWDALDGLQIADATALAARHHPDLDPDRPALIAQVYGRMVASDVKLVLLNQYPEDHPVTLVSGAGGPGARVATVPLHALDRHEGLDDLTTAAVPPLGRPGSLLTLADVVARLRAPDGCPWDREQTHLSLRPYLLEEAHEVLEALDAEDAPALADELGDLLLQVVLHAQIAVEAGDFGLADVVRAITEKLVRRHPHVFGDVTATTSEAVVANWEALKAEERAQRGAPDDPLAGVPRGLPALARAQALVRKAGRAGLSGGTAADPAAELAVAADRLGAAPDAERLGDLLLAAVRLAVARDLDAESALREATARRAIPPPA